MSIRTQDGRSFMENHIESLYKKLEKYEEALKFYADKEGTWGDGEYEDGLWVSVAERDNGTKARQVLKQ